MTVPYIQTFEGVFYLPAVAQNVLKPYLSIYSTTDAPGGQVNGIYADPRILEIEFQALTNADAEIYILLTGNAADKGTPTDWLSFPNLPRIGGAYHTTLSRFTNESSCPMASGHALTVYGVVAILPDYTVDPTRGSGQSILRRISLPAGVGNSQVICFPDEGVGSTGFFGPVSETGGGVDFVERGPGIQIWSGPGNSASVNPAMLVRIRWQEVPRIPGLVTTWPLPP